MDWWNRPRLLGHAPLLAQPLLEVVTRAWAVVQVGGLSGCGPERGRNFERLFYKICDRSGVLLCERAGARTLASQSSASGFAHEVDGGSRGAACITHWELKHLSGELSKNELLVFNGKGLDFLQGSDRMWARVPMCRFLLTGRNVRDECRRYSVAWGIVTIEPDLFPLALLYEAVTRGAGACLREPERRAICSRLPWASRPLQRVLSELVEWTASATNGHELEKLQRAVNEVLDLQEQLGPDVLDWLDSDVPGWLDDVAEDTWSSVGGW